MCSSNRYYFPGGPVCSPNRYQFSRNTFLVTEQIPIFYFENHRTDREFPRRYPLRTDISEISLGGLSNIRNSFFVFKGWNSNLLETTWATWVRMIFTLLDHPRCSSLNTFQQLWVFAKFGRQSTVEDGQPSLMTRSSIVLPSRCLSWCYCAS